MSHIAEVIAETLQYALEENGLDDMGLSTQWTAELIETELAEAGYHIVIKPRPTPPICCLQCNPDYTFMMLCRDCGNKRCPKATNHILACTGSNASGQEGSIYA